VDTIHWISSEWILAFDSGRNREFVCEVVWVQSGGEKALDMMSETLLDEVDVAVKMSAN
jgi:hypothetical protein